MNTTTKTLPKDGSSSSSFLFLLGKVPLLFVSSWEEGQRAVYYCSLLRSSPLLSLNVRKMLKRRREKRAYWGRKDGERGCWERAREHLISGNFRGDVRSECVREREANGILDNSSWGLLGFCEKHHHQHTYSWDEDRKEKTIWTFFTLFVTLVVK